MKAPPRKQFLKSLCLLLALAASALTAAAQNLPQVWSVPKSGTFWSMQFPGNPPLPFLPDWLPQGTALYLVSSNRVYVYDDRNVDYPALNTLLQAADLISSQPPAQGGGYGPSTEDWGPNDLWLEIELLSLFWYDLILHNPQTGKLYQWVATSDLKNPFGVPAWTPGQIISASTPTNSLYFSAIPPSFPLRFFRAAGGDTKISIVRTFSSPEAQEPCTPTGSNIVTSFDIVIDPPVNRQVTVVYALSGSAENGVDYTNLSGSINLPAFAGSTNLCVSPIYDTIWELEETVVITLVLTNDYLIDPIAPSASCVIRDCTTNLFTVVATNVPSPVEIDYHPPTKSLLLSANYDDNGLPYNFVRLDTNGTVSQWATVSNLYDEVKFAVVKTTTNGWTSGYTYFGSDAQIGFVSHDAATVNPSWVTLTNGVVVNPLHLRGSICWDETGIWGNDLIAVCSEAAADNTTLKGVWRINAAGQVSLVANLRTDHLEGVMTVPNDTTKYGPWAGKILTGDETIRDENYRPAPLIYAVDTYGTTTAYALGIQAEDFDLVTTNDLYCVNYCSPDTGQPSRILKVSGSVLTNFIGDILITQAGEYQDPFHPDTALKPRLFFVHWDGAKFVTRSITLPDDFKGAFEHLTFAPIALPNMPQ